MTIITSSGFDPKNELLNLTICLHTFITYLNERHRRQVDYGLKNEAAYTMETINALKEINDDMYAILEYMPTIITDTPY